MTAKQYREARDNALAWARLNHPYQRAAWVRAARYWHKRYLQANGVSK